MRKKLTTKLSLFLLFVLSVSLAQAQALLTQNFDFSGNITANGWTAHSAGGTNAIATTTGLTYTGLLGSGVGNAVLVSNLGGEDDNITFANQNTVGQNVYFSCMINVTEAAATKSGDYFLNIGSGGGATFSAFAARVFAKVTATGVNFGISNTSTATYGTTNFSKNTTYLLIVKYTIAASGSTPVSLWIIPSGVPTTEALAGTPELTNTTTAGVSSVSALAFRQGSSTTSPQLVVDGLLVGTTWADVTPAVATGPTLGASTQISNLITPIGTASTSKSFNLSGSNLTGAPGTITIATSSNNFEVSTDNASWDFSTTVNYTSATLAPTPIYVRLSADATPLGAISGTLSITGGGTSTALTVNTSGLLVVAAPTVQASNVLVSNITDNGFDVNWTNGNGEGRILVVRQTATAAVAPTSGSIYTVPTTTGSGNSIWYSGAASGPITVTGLSSGTNYTVQVYEYNGTTGNSNYNISTATNNPATALTTGISSSLQQGYFTSVSTPLYAGKSTYKMPHVYVATVSGLAPNTSYRYYAQAAASTDFNTTSSGAGTLILNDYNNAVPLFYTASTGSLSTVGSHGKFTSDATGKFTGTFGFFTSTNTRFDSANQIYPSITIGLDTGVSAVKYRFALNQSITMLTYSTSGPNTGSLIKGTSAASPNKVVALWKSEDGSSIVSARPLSMTLVENNGATTGTMNALYDSTDGSWNTIIPNDLANGVRLIQQFNLDGSLVGCNSDADGVWGTTNTVNPATGIASVLQISTADAPLSSGTCFGILPMRMESFSVRKDGNASKLTWTTTQEINSKQFVIERSTNNGNSWSSIATVSAAGNSFSKMTYSYTDITPSKGLNFYRIKLVDADNKFSNSDTKSVLFGITDMVFITPNPASNYVNIYLSKNNNSLSQIIVSDANGKTIEKINTADQTYQLKTSGYPKGLYFIKVAGTNSTSTQKIIIQ